MARFRDGKGNSYECDRQTKTLKLVSVENVERFKNKEHDAFTFTDGEDTYVYYASLNAGMTEYDTVFARGLSLCEGEFVKMSAYFVPNNKEYFIYNPRLLSVEEGE